MRLGAEKGAQRLVFLSASLFGSCRLRVVFRNTRMPVRNGRSRTAFPRQAVLLTRILDEEADARYPETVPWIGSGPRQATPSNSGPEARIIVDLRVNLPGQDPVYRNMGRDEHPVHRRRSAADRLRRSCDADRVGWAAARPTLGCGPRLVRCVQRHPLRLRRGTVWRRRGCWRASGVPPPRTVGSAGGSGSGVRWDAYDGAPAGYVAL